MLLKMEPPKLKPRVYSKDGDFIRKPTTVLTFLQHSQNSTPGKDGKPKRSSLEEFSTSGFPKC
jgi:hypothetical protein